MPAPEEGDKVQVTPLLLESCMSVAVMVVDFPAARDAPALDARAIAMGVELLQPATKPRQQTHTAHIKRERVLFIVASLGIVFFGGLPGLRTLRPG